MTDRRTRRRVPRPLLRHSRVPTPRRDHSDVVQGRSPSIRDAGSALCVKGRGSADEEDETGGGGFGGEEG